ncbi:hypothetical protein [Flavobacterium sp. KACC 22761]|uniref:hypothetical protein n=1 Tax=Flavobacterium sp. KACC 22761 TaxID=3092665 RepID=UPI002A75D675|nr:hypothetical protein [Flavobacterium sp. KACC 22761]WPO76852.1 hypothetical protein SCB73_11260 [Flavobacterium sp. KACC 22761]
MKKVIYLLFCHLTLLTFGQESAPKSKLIRGFVFDNSEYASIPLPAVKVPIEIVGTGRKTKTDDDGKFEIEAKEGDMLIIQGDFIKTQKILITDKNCYEFNLGTVTGTGLIYFQSKKAARQTTRFYSKLVKKLLKKMESGFYDCAD